MKKKSISTYDIFVKKLGDSPGKIFIRDDLLWHWQIAGGSKHRFSYGLGKAKNDEVLLQITHGIYRVQQSSGVNTSFDENYWDLVALLIRIHAPRGAIIAHEKAIELHIQNFEIPEILVLYTYDTAKRIQIGPYKLHFRTLKSGEKTNGKNMYRILLDQSKKIIIRGHTFHTLGIESALLDIASIKNQREGISEPLLLKYIRKYENSYNRDVFGELVSYRYIRAMNRIRNISKEHGFQRLYELSLDVIKKEGGGCFLHL